MVDHQLRSVRVEDVASHVLERVVIIRTLLNMLMDKLGHDNLKGRLSEASKRTSQRDLTPSVASRLSFVDSIASHPIVPHPIALHHSTCTTYLHMIFSRFVREPDRLTHDIRRNTEEVFHWVCVADDNHLGQDANVYF